MFQTNQGVQALDPNQIIAAQRGDGVVSGLAVTIQSGLTLAYTAGVVKVDGETYEIGSGTCTLQTANASNPRKDVIYVNDEGQVAVVVGDPQAILPEGQQLFNTSSPSPASLNGVRCAILAEIYIAPNQTTLTSNDVRDRRLAPVQTPATNQLVLSFLTPHIRWTDDLVNSEIFRIDTTEYTALNLKTLFLNRKNGGAVNEDMSLIIYNDTGSSVLLSVNMNDTASGDISLVGVNIILLQITNGTGVDQDACVGLIGTLI